MAYRYKPNKYVIYDDTLTFQENYDRDAVITKKKLDRLEDQVRLNSADLEIGTVKYVERTEEAEFSLDFNEIEGTRRLNMAIPLRGKSAYQSWLDIGNVGTEEDFINDLKGIGQHRVKLKRFEMENIHGNNDAFLSIYKCLDDEARIYVEHKADATGAVPEFNARFYGPFNAASAKIVYSPDITDSNYEEVAVIKDEDDCMYVGRRIVSGVMDGGVWKSYSTDPAKAKSYWKVMWYDSEGILIDVDRYNIVFVDAADKLLYTDADSVSDLKKEFTTLLNDAVNNLTTELNATNETLNNSVSDINTKLDETNTTINNTASEIRNEMQESNEQITDNMTNLESDINTKLDETNTTITNTASEIRSEMQASNEQINTNMTNLESDINTKLDETNTTITNTASEIRNEMQTSNEQIADDMATLESNMDAKIDTLDKRTKIKTV